MSDEKRCKAEEAANILQSELFNSVFAKLDANIVAQWRVAQNFEQQNSLYYQQLALRKVWENILGNLEEAANDAAKNKDKTAPWREFWHKFSTWRK